MSFAQIKYVVDESMLKTEEDESEEPDAAPTPPTQHRVRFNPEHHIMLEEAQKIKKSAQVGDEMAFPLETKDDFGMIVAQTAKQVIIQRIREAEKESIYGEFKKRQGEIISGIVQRMEGGNVFVDLGRATAILPERNR